MAEDFKMRPFMVGFLSAGAALIGWGFFSFFDPSPSSKDLNSQEVSFEDFGGITGDLPVNFETLYYDLEKDGKTVKTCFPRKTSYVIHIWATWCPPCVKELPEYEKIAAQHPEKFITLSSDSLNAIKTFYKEKNISGLSVASNEDKQIMQRLEIRSLPTTLIIKEDGKTIMFSGLLPWKNKNFIKMLKKELKI
jgi:thiol-disulfide isomerase/thioredoxin